MCRSNADHSLTSGIRAPTAVPQRQWNVRIAATAEGQSNA